MLGYLVPHLEGIGIAMPAGRTVRVGVVPLGTRRLGFCCPARKSESGNVNFIGLSPAAANPLDLAHVLLHEFLHAADDCMSGHRHRWARWATAVGIKRTGTERTDSCQVLLEGALQAVGAPAQHEPTAPVLPAIFAAEPSQQRVACSACKQHAYIPRKAYLGGMTLICGECSVEMFPVPPRRRGAR
jgi:hypothetical protein